MPNPNLPVFQTQARFIQGNEAVAEGALASGLNFFAGYPITPANEISEILAKQLPLAGQVFIQMEDELATISAIMGASLGGAKAATATSGPGFSLMQEGIGYAAIAEVPGVIIDVQRTGPGTGRPTSPGQGDVMQARWGSHGDYPIIALCPSSVSETYRLTIRAFNLAEKYRTPVILLMDEVVAHMWEQAELLPPEEVVQRTPAAVPPQRYLPYDDAFGDVPPWASFGTGYRYNVTGLFHNKSGFPSQRLEEIDPWLQRLFRKIENNLDDIIEVERENVSGAETVIVAYGITARSAQRALKLAQRKGRAVGLVKLLTLWPFPEKEMEHLVRQQQRIVVAEMNRGQILREVERIANGKTEVKGINKFNGELINPYHILEAIEGK